MEFPSERETADAPVDEYAFVMPQEAQSTEANPPPIVVRGRRRTLRPVSVDHPPPRLLLPLAVVAAVVGMVGAMCLWAGAKTAGVALIGSISLLVPFAWVHILDRVYRDRIHQQLEALRCTVTRISWKPFQGLLFDRGWKRYGRCRFYKVEYTERDGTPKTELCAVGTCIGPLWGDEIDSFGGVSHFGSGRSAQLPFIGVGAMLIIAISATFTELRYAVSGRVVQGNITRVSEVHSTRSRSSSHRTKTRIEYEFAEADGSIRKESVVQSSLAMLARGNQPVEVEYVPGAKGWSRLHGQTRIGWVYGLGAVVLILAAVCLLDHFDVFGLHRKQA
jgi:hypothetical protein